MGRCVTAKAADLAGVDSSIKCVTEAGSSACTRCKEGERDCVFDSKFRFKEVRHVDTASQGSRSRTHLVYEDNQRWVPTREAVGFVLEDGAGAEYGTTDFIERSEQRDYAVEAPVSNTGMMNPPRVPGYGTMDLSERNERLDNANDAPKSNAGLRGHPRAHSMPADPPETHDGHHTEPIDLDTPSAQGAHVSPQAPELSPAIGSWYAHSDRHSESGNRLGDATRPQTRDPAATEDYTSPASLSELSRRHESGRRLTWGTGEYGFLVGDSIQASPAANAVRTPANTATIDLSHREALLLQYFIQKLAPWVDCCDCTCQFAQEVPRRALRIPMVLYAVLAVSSRHQSLMVNHDELEASYYHGHCLELVISALSQPDRSYDDNLFATIVCMRVYEELDEEVDDFLHLQGVGRLLSAIPTFAYSGGLAEAASWQALRQDIYVALSNKTQPSFDLASYGRSRVFDFRDDDACANVVIWLFARILRRLYSPSDSTYYDAWTDIERDIETWDAQRSLIFQPLYVKDADPSQHQPWPVVRLINPAQVVALQYFYACQVLLRQHKPPDHSLRGFEAVREQRNTERDLVAALCTIIGLAESNNWVENANFTAHHMLKCSGYHITNPIQREHSVSFLRHVQDTMGFKTQSTITLLCGQWQDLDGSA